MSEVKPVDGKEKKQAETRETIKRTALALLNVGGFENLSMHKIAGWMGTTTPALYYYYKNRDALLADLSVDVSAFLETYLRETHAAHAHEAFIRQAFVILSGYYNWARENPAYYRLLFGTPVLRDSQAVLPSGQNLSCLSILFEVCQQAAKMNLLAKPALALTPKMLEELEAFSENLGVALSPEVVFMLVVGWTRLHGIISLELDGHLTQVMSNLDRTYFLEARKLLEELGFNPQKTE
ncbi:MAG TPA: TetR/AcrR family transcriptional regulator [Anaerolineales bacterium]|nr:TetR/AcrR family transcriptional regulator [Anaerolineales bacterium]